VSDATRRAELHAQCSALIDSLADGGQDPDARDALLSRLLQYQRATVPAYARLCAQWPEPEPALPTDVFRFARVASHPATDDVRVFRTSGSTQEQRGAHAFRELSLYERAARAAARYALFPDRARLRLLILAPSESEAPDSSLSFMLARFVDWFGAPGSRVYLRDGKLDMEDLVTTLHQAEQSGEALALLGTSFAFVHAHDALAGARFVLPRGSRLMQTGGFKGRAREVAPAEMLELLSADYGLDPRYVVQEYGMTELSSQLYETPLREVLLGQPATPRRLWVPGWMRVTPVDAVTLRPVSGEGEGLLRVDDLANLDSVASIQTSDRGQRSGDGVRVLGRAAGAVPRGCSLAMDAALSAAEEPRP
jgi:hypothetical protein